MLANLAATAKMIALARDREKGAKTGLVTDDFRQGVERLAKQQQGLNHSFDLWDFAERKGIQPQDMRIERCFGST
jgi:FMN phosphatase YigB (HAD superfamily)